jgi:hypothetical protein
MKASRKKQHLNRDLYIVYYRKLNSRFYNKKGITVNYKNQLFLSIDHP